MKKTLLPVLLASTTLLVGCIDQKNNNADSSAPTVKKEDAVAVVNGHYISKQALEDLKKQIAQRAPGQSIPEKQLLEELIRRQIIVEKAVEEGLDKTPEFQAKMNEIRTSLLTQLYLQDYLKKHPVSEEELKAEYDAMIGQQGGTEFKARHILVKSQEEAEKIISELNKGADFAELAKKHSTGPSGPQGGDLGWFTADRMVKPFSDAVIALEDGKYTTEPVQTRFGWHVILREESRKQTPPPLEAVKQQLEPMLQRKKVQQMLEELKKQAKVELLLKEETKPVTPPALNENPVTPAENNSTQSATDKTEQAVDSAKQTATDAVESAKKTADKAVEKAKKVAEETTDNAKKAATDVAESVKQSADKVKDAVNAVTAP
jgi:peptidyl-prolyl cis-trans isomerase C